MGAPGGPTIINIGADPADVLAAFDQIIASTEDVAAALDSMAGGASLGDLDASLSELQGLVQEVSTGMNDLAAGEDAAAASSEGLGSAFGLVGDAIDGLMGNLTTLLPMFLEFEAIGGAIQAIQGFVGNMIGMNEQFQRMDVTLKDIVGAQRAQQLIAWVQKFGTEVPFTTEAVSSATVALTAFGQNAEQVLPAVAAAAAAMASRGVTLDTATRAFIDAMNGRFIMLQNTLGISKEELVKFGLELDKKGHVINNSFVPAFEKLVAAKYPTILADQMGTFGGMLAEANDLLQLFAMHLGAPLFAAAQEGLGMVMQFVSDHQSDLDHIAEVAGGILADGFRFFGDVIAGVGVILKTVIFPVFQGLGNLIQPLVGPLGNVAGAFGRLAGAVAGGLVKGLSDMAQGFRDMTGAGGPLQGVVQGIAGGLNSVATWLNNVWQGLTQGKGPMASLKADVQPLAGAFKSAGDAFQAFLKWFEPAAPKFLLVGDAIVRISGHASGFMQTLQRMATFLKPLGDLLTQIGAIFVNIGEGIGGFFAQMNLVNGLLLPLWQNIQQQLGPALSQLWDTIQQQLMPAFEHLATALKPLAPVFQLIGYIIGGILLTALDTLINVLASVATLITGVLNGALELLSGTLNYLAGTVKFFTDLFTGHFDRLRGDVIGVWNAFLEQLKGIWDATGGNIINAVAGFVDNFLTWVQYLANELVGHSIWPDMLNEMVNQLAGFPGRALAIIHQFGGAVVGFFTSLAGNALSWGEDLILNLINGIWNMLPSLESAANAAAQTIANLLHHSEPKEGPLAGDSQWGRHFVENWITSMKGKLPELNALTKQMAGSLVPSVGGVPVGAAASGIAAAGGPGGLGSPTALIAALQQLTNQLGRAQPLGATPTSAQLGSVTQQFGDVNISGIGGQNLQSLSAELNFIFGLMFENAKRGAVNP